MIDRTCFNKNMKRNSSLSSKDIELLKTLFPTKSEMVDMKEEILESQNTFKNEFFERIDPVLKEVNASREEREIVAGKLSELEERTENLEKVVFKH